MGVLEMGVPQTAISIRLPEFTMFTGLGLLCSSSISCFPAFCLSWSAMGTALVLS
jgi:hypothetical protein